MRAQLGPTALALNPGSAFACWVTSSELLYFSEPFSSLLKEVNDFGSKLWGLLGYSDKLT